MYTINVFWEIEKIFLYYAIVFGCLFIIFTPPFQAPDEYNHFFRAYKISEGGLISLKLKKSEVSQFYNNFPGMELEASDYLVGNYLPTDLIKMTQGISEDIPGKTKNKQIPRKIIEYLFNFNKSTNYTFTNFPNSSLYSPIPYTPQVFAILISRLFGFSYLMMLYLSRAFNLLTYIALVFYALKHIPQLKVPLMLLALMPTQLFLAASASPDVLLIGLSYLIFFLVFSIGTAKENNKYQIKLYLFISLLLGLIKMVYVLLPLGLLAFGKKYYKVAVSAFCLSLISMSLWQFICRNLYVPLRLGVDPTLQINFILDKPITYLRIVINTLVGNREHVFTQVVGNFGWLDTPLNYGFVLFYITLVIVSVMINVGTFRLKSITRFILFFIGVATCIAIISSLYLSWSPVGNLEVLGLVGKNFLPVIPFLLPLLYGWFNVIKLEKFNFFLFMFIPLSLIYSLSALVIRFYL
jgi:uncharacterized membrane protein